MFVGKAGTGIEIFRFPGFVFPTTPTTKQGDIMSDAMDVDDGPRGAKRKADALDDTATPRRIKVRRWPSTRVLPFLSLQGAKLKLPRLSTKMSLTRSLPEKSLWPRCTR